MTSLRFLLLLIVLLGGSLPTASARGKNAQATLVVYNSADPVSTILAKYYALKRDIPDDQIIGLKCSIEEEISPDEYQKSIATPLRQHFNKHGWWTMQRDNSGYYIATKNRIRFIALIRGIPLKIHSGLLPQGGPTPPPLKTAAPTPTPLPVPTPKPTERKECSVDTQLACLGIRGFSDEGPLNNPYFRSFQKITETTLGGIMLVARLDGPDADTVRKMIDASLEAEKSGIGGIAYIDSRNINSGAYAKGDKWMATIAKDTRARGIPTIFDRAPSIYPTGYPMTQAGLYYGWYTTHVSGPFTNKNFRFRPGAVAVHIHSFSGITVRNPLRNWVAPLLHKGAAATLGNVYEPYLDLTPHLDIFNNRLLNGFTFAEAAYMSLRGLSWMTTIVGDPLYRPFASLASYESIEATKEMQLWESYRAAAKNFSNNTTSSDRLKALSDQYQTGLFFEGLGQSQLAEGKSSDAFRSFSQARKHYSATSDKIRNHLHEIRYLQVTKGKPAALKHLNTIIGNYPAAPTDPAENPTASSALKIVKKELTPTPTPTQKPSPNKSKKTKSKKAAAKKKQPPTKVKPLANNPAVTQKSPTKKQPTATKTSTIPPYIPPPPLREFKPTKKK